MIRILIRGWLALCYSMCLTGAELAQLRQLEEAKRYFELRRALAETAGGEAEVGYYRALTEARFGQEAVGVEHLRAFLATNPDTARRRKALEELANALLRNGQYKDAAVELDALLALMPQDDAERADTNTGRAICETLRDMAPQTVGFGPDVPLRAEFHKPGLWTVPVTVNGNKSAWILDTGANLSTLTESEAKRLGLEVRDSAGTVGSGHTGIQTPFRLAVAADVQIGRARLHKVVFTVVADRAMHFGPLGMFRLSGILGLPVIRALGSIGVSANGDVRIEPESPKLDGEPNIFFEGLMPITEVLHAGRAIPMSLDTGGNTSYLYPGFRDALTAEEHAKLTKHKMRSAGVGGSIKLETEVVPLLQLELPGRVVTLRKVDLRMGDSKASPSDGLLGMDALQGGFTLDFRAMRLNLD